jgi:hypothetical protein
MPRLRQSDALGDPDQREVVERAVLDLLAE